MARGLRIAFDADQDFLARSTAPGVFAVDPFDEVADLGDDWTAHGGIGVPERFGYKPGAGTNASTPVIDTDIKVSGAGSLKFTLNSGSQEAGGGRWQTKFPASLGSGTYVEIGENEEFWAQIRFRVNAGWLEMAQQNQGSKFLDFGDGSENPALVMQSQNNFLYPMLYTGGPSFQLRDGVFIQPPRLCAPLVTGPTDCFALEADQWVTAKFHLDIFDKRPGGTHWDARIRMWLKRYGQPKELVVDYGPDTASYDTNSPDGFPCDGHPGGYPGWILFPFTTGKGTHGSGNTHATAHLWFDEGLLSRQEIADPADL